MNVKCKPAVPSIVKYGARNAKNDLQVRHFIKKKNVQWLENEISPTLSDRLSTSDQLIRLIMLDPSNLPLFSYPSINEMAPVGSLLSHLVAGSIHCRANQ